MGFAAVTAAPAIEPGQLLEVLANIDLGTKRWRRKAQLVSILGRWGDGHRVGIRELNRRTGISFTLLEQLLAELVEARVVLVVELGTGSRPTTWAVSPAIDRWRGVPWVRPVDAVERWAFHVAQERYANPGQRSAYGSPSERRPKQRSEGGAYAERKKSQRSEGGAYAERNEKPAFRPGGVGRALIEAEPEKGFPTRGSAHPSSSSSAREEEEAAAIDPGEWASLRRLVMTAGGGAYLAGGAADQLAGVVCTHGAEQVRAWVMEAPKRLGVPMLVEWLATRAYAPTADELAALEARPDDDQAPAAGPVEAAPIDQLARPLLRPVAEVLAADGPPAPADSVRAALREARGLLDPLGTDLDDRLTTTEVTQ